MLNILSLTLVRSMNLSFMDISYLDSETSGLTASLWETPIKESFCKEGIILVEIVSSSVHLQ